jgi:hypothetical protein
MLKLPVEPTFNEFVQTVGGELIEKLLPNNDGRKRADYLFRSLPLIAELKCLENEIDMREHAQKLTALRLDWQRRGLVRPIYGTTTIELQKLPKRCQDEWMALYEAPIQKHILSDANKQIRQAKESLGLPHAKGVVLIANEEQTFSSPANLFTFVARIFKKTKAEGQILYSNIHYVVVLSVNMLVISPERPNGTLVWFSGYRGKAEDSISAFLQGLGNSWMKFCAAKRGNELLEVRFSKPEIEDLGFVKPPYDPM